MCLENARHPFYTTPLCIEWFSYQSRYCPGLRPTPTISLQPHLSSAYMTSQVTQHQLHSTQVTYRIKGERRQRLLIHPHPIRLLIAHRGNYSSLTIDGPCSWRGGFYPSRQQPNLQTFGLQSQLNESCTSRSLRPQRPAEALKLSADCVTISSLGFHIEQAVCAARVQVSSFAVGKEMSLRGVFLSQRIGLRDAGLGDVNLSTQHDITRLP